MKIQRTMQFMYPEKSWYVGKPKSESGARIIPLTDEAIRILKVQKEKVSNLKVIPIEYCDYVFLDEEGLPISNSAYDSYLDRISLKYNIPNVSMHILRHTFATRCIEGGVQPKTLQMLLGHSKLSMTMDLYVTVTNDEKKKEIERVADVLNVV